MSARRLTLAVRASLCTLGLFVFASGSAGAAVRHEFLPGVSGKISEGVPAEGPHGEPVALPGLLNHVGSTTVDSGELYVGEFDGEAAGKARVDAFDASSGAFASQFPQVSSPSSLFQGIAVGHSTGEAQVYVGGDEFSEGEERGVVAVLNPAGSVQGVWKGPDPAKAPEGLFDCFGCHVSADITVDGNPSSLNDWAAGDVYVIDYEKRVVDVFKPLAGGGEEYVTQLPGGTGVAFSGPSSVAVNPFDGEVLVADRAPGSVLRSVVDIFRPAAFAGQYEFVGTLPGPLSGGSFGSVEGVTVDGGNGDIYVWEPSFVDQFDSEGRLIDRLTGTPVGSSGEERAFHNLASVAVDPVSHHVYVTDLSGREGEPTVVDVFGPNVVLPDVTTAPATGVKTVGEGEVEATLNGAVNPDGEGEASCWFVWGTSTEFGQSAPCEPEKVADHSSSVAVHATLHGLAPDTTYYYRLQASNKNGTNAGSPSHDEQFTASGPGLHGEAVSSVRAESATFDAKINPHGAPTSYYFQYGPSSAYSSDTPALGEEAKYGASIGSGEGDVEVSRHVQGLPGGTVYHYRVVAISELAPGEFEAFYGPDQTFTTQTVGVPLGLPDGRAWEMVSPPQKEGAMLVGIGNSIVQASANGSAFTDSTLFEPTEGAAAGAYGFGVPVFFGRGSDGWTSKVIAPPHSGPTQPPVGNGQEYRFFSEDLSKGVLQPFGLFTPLVPGVTESTPYVHMDFLNGNAGELCTTDCYRPLVTAANVPSGTRFGGEPSGECTNVFCGPTFLGGTPDLSHVVLESPVTLTSTPTEGNGGLYEWSDGKLQLVSLLPEGESNEQGGPVAIVAQLGDQNKDARHAISDDGTRIIWEGNLGNGGQGQHLYLRDIVKGETVRLDVFQGVEVGAEANHVIRYVTASSDGSRIFFLDGERLTPDSTANGDQPDLYEYNLTAAIGNRLTDLSVAGKPQEAANVSGVSGASEDGSYVYFTAAGALARGVAPGKCGIEARTGETQLCNLYVRHEGKTVFIAGLSQEDYPDWAPVVLTDRVSADGRWFAFMSDRNLTGYDTTDAIGKHPAEEVYLYDAVNGKLTCASCNPTGARPVGVKYSGEQIVAPSGVFDSSTWVASNVPPWTGFDSGDVRYQSRYLSDSGRLFFDSNDALVPQDVNGTQDVYEYEPAGVGDCSASSLTFSERSGGCLAPVSSGTSNEESAFLDASETGGDVFFLTGAKLASQDFDNQLDVYDASECTASRPCFAPAPVAPPECDTGESCKPAQASQPTLFGSPSSATFSGTGNVTHPASGRVVGSKSLMRKQKLARALRACHHKKKRGQRVACERYARRRYGARAASKAASSTRDLSGRTGR